MLRLTFCFLCGLLMYTPNLGWAADGGSSSHPLEVSVCDLAQTPKTYDKRWIKVRGRVSIEFEDFSLYDPTCAKTQAPGIWLMFGGDQETPTAYCCGDHTPAKGKDVSVEGIQIPLVRDGEFQELLRVMTAERRRRPDGMLCESAECKFYGPITATIEGLFFSGYDGSQSLTPGYGHLGCCHLLVINKVSEVSAGRTPVPAGGAFRCTEETWDPTTAESASLWPQISCPEVARGSRCEESRRQAFEKIASHWHDRIEAANGRLTDSPTAWRAWDLLTSYAVDEVTSASANDLTLKITRKACVLSVRSPLPASDRLTCKNYSFSWEQNEDQAREVNGLLAKEQFVAAEAKIADAAQHLLTDGDQSWRHTNGDTAAWDVLQQEALRWGLALDAHLQLDKCEDAGLDEQPSRIFDCSWFAADGMQSAYVTLRKYPKSTKADPSGSQIPWMVQQISAVNCGAER